ncbi:hypothetical protein NDU88_003288 [Pleurodeles waltl]|uniref:Uncharacterized protein n=1 Tax=Pleurodeles waltl TaxID=8319 RepID=A0AAV7UYJ8_PLEWA|nr:hypothetical protein NDU88_003288 [Pleurodeles waltl]
MERLSVAPRQAGTLAGLKESTGDHAEESRGIESASVWPLMRHCPVEHGCNLGAEGRKQKEEQCATPLGTAGGRHDHCLSCWARWRTGGDDRVTKYPNRVHNGEK